MSADERRLVAEASRRLRKQLRRAPAAPKPEGAPTILEPQPATLDRAFNGVDGQARVEAGSRARA